MSPHTDPVARRAPILPRAAPACLPGTLPAARPTKETSP